MAEAAVLCPETPYPLHGGGHFRTACLLEYLRKRYAIDLIVFREPQAPHPAELLPEGLARRLCVLDLPHHGRSAGARAFRACSRLVRGVPPLVDRFSGFERQIRAFVKGHEYALVLLEHFWVAHYAWLFNSRRIVLDLHNIESVLLDRCAAAGSWPVSSALRRFARYSREREAQLLPRFTQLLVASSGDAKQVETQGNPLVIPNAIPLVPLPLPPKRFEIAFSGNFEYLPNRTAIEWFHRHVWPRLRVRFPQLRWRLIGRNPGRYLEWQRDPHIELTGPVVDAVEELARAQAAIVPLLAGSGTRLKILEAWAAGLPVVSTAIGAEGLEEGAFIAASPKAFIAELSRLLESPAERKAAGEQNRSLFEQKYNWPAVWRILEEARF